VNDDDEIYIRLLRFTKPLRAELEIKELGRENIERLATIDTRTGAKRHEVRTLPFILFINDFSIYRNMYRVLKAFY